jgi:hypothetical protein
VSGSGRIVFAPNAYRSGPQADPESHLGLLRQFQGIVDLNAEYRAVLSILLPAGNSAERF